MSQNNQDKIISKIKKCLALAKSNNPHEAAAALRQARKMMTQYQINEADVLLSDIGEMTAVQLAVYAYTVVQRQLKQSRAEYSKTLFRYKKSNRIKLANIFCLGYVSGIRQQIENLNAQTHPYADKIEQYMALKYNDLTSCKNNRMDDQAINERLVAKARAAKQKGWEAGKNTTLYKPINAHQGANLLNT